METKGGHAASAEANLIRRFISNALRAPTRTVGHDRFKGPHGVQDGLLNGAASSKAGSQIIGNPLN